MTEKPFNGFAGMPGQPFRDVLGKVVDEASRRLPSMSVRHPARNCPSSLSGPGNDVISMKPGSE